MNNYYHYSYSNGTQFVSTAALPLIEMYFNTKHKHELPNLIGVWKFKNVKQK